MRRAAVRPCRGAQIFAGVRGALAGSARLQSTPTARTQIADDFEAVRPDDLRRSRSRNCTQHEPMAWPIQSNVMIVSSSPQLSTHTAWQDALMVATPLDAIAQLETRPRVCKVVLAGAYATNHEFAAALGELYPAVRVEREV